MPKLLNSLLFWYAITLAVQVAVLTRHGIENVSLDTIHMAIFLEIVVPPLIKMYVVEGIEKWYQKKHKRNRLP